MLSDSRFLLLIVSEDLLCFTSETSCIKSHDLGMLPRTNGLDTAKVAFGMHIKERSGFVCIAHHPSSSFALSKTILSKAYVDSSTSPILVIICPHECVGGLA